MKNQITKRICGTVLSFILSAAAFLSPVAALPAFAGEQYNNDYWDGDGYPHFFDVSKNILEIKAGESEKINLFSRYKYTYYIKGAESKNTYCECTWNSGNSTPVFHIGADETPGKSIYFYFYVNDDRFTTPTDNDVFITVEVRVKPGDVTTAQASTPLPGTVTAIKFSGKQSGTFATINNGTVGAVYDSKNIPVAAFAVLSPNGTIPALTYTGVVANNKANYIGIATADKGTGKIMISDTDKASLTSKGFAGICLNGNFLPW